MRRDLGPFVWSHSYRGQFVFSINSIRNGKEFTAVSVYFASSIVILQAMPYNSSEAKRQMLAECRAYYRGNRKELFTIDEFDRTYQPTDAIYWYTRSCFLYRTINRVLRTEDILAQYTFRYFIVDMCSRLEEAAAVTRAHYTKPFQVYRGTKISRDEVDQLYVGMLVAPNGFFSSSGCLDVAHRFIGIDPITNLSPCQSREERRQYALLEIEIDLNHLPDNTVADVSGQSILPDEHEIIFNLGTAFIITEINYDVERHIWCIHMIPSSEVARINNDYKAYIRKRLTEIEPRLLFGNVLVDMSSNLIGALRYFHRLLRSVALHDEQRPNIYYHLARIYRYMGKYQQAILYYRCAKLLQRRRLPQSNLDYCRTLAGIGSVFSEIGDSIRAVALYTRVWAAFRQMLPEDHIEIGHISHQLAYAYWQERQYEHALLLVSRSLSFFRRKMPANHPGEAQALHTMGLVQHALGHREQAINCFEQALHIRESLQAKNAPATAYECYQLSVIYAEQIDEHEIAMQYAQRALSICQASLPAKNIRLRQLVEYVQHLSQHRDA